MADQLDDLRQRLKKYAAFLDEELTDAERCIHLDPAAAEKKLEYWGHYKEAEKIAGMFYSFFHELTTK